MSRTPWIAALGVLVGCLEPTTYLEGAPCPCAADFVCCAPSQTCVRAEACAASVELHDIQPNIANSYVTTLATITGAGFLPGMRVSVGPDPCLELEVVSTTEMRCLVPRGSASTARVDVVVTLPTGETAVLRGAFRYVLPPYADVTPTAGLDSRPFGYAPTVIDWDDDGQLDLLYANLDRGLVTPTLFLGRGPLSYLETPTGLPWVATMRAISADFTGDGRTDVLLAGRDREFIALYARDDEGAWTLLTQPIDLNPQQGGLSGPSPADFDGDGDLDVIGCRNVTGIVAPTMVYLDNRGDATFALDRSRVPDTLPGRNGSPVCHTGALGDFDRDGDADYLACGDMLALMVNEGGVFVDRTEALGLPTEIDTFLRIGCRSISWVDYDADGDLDIAWVYTNDNLTSVESGTVIYENRLDEQQAPLFANVRTLRDDVTALACPNVEVDHPDASLHGGGNAAFWIDADHDGDEDLFLPLATATCLTPLTLYENFHADGEAKFVARYLPTNGVLGRTSAAAIADLDGDGDLDFAIQGWGYAGGDRGVFRSNLMENAGTDAGPRGAYLRVRARLGTTVEIDLDGGPNGEPDFARGRGKRLVRSVASQTNGGIEPVAHFGLGPVDGPVWVRATGGGAAMKVTELNTEITLP